MFNPGQDVVVTFDGEDCPGEVIDNRNGWVLAKVLIDPMTDHSPMNSSLSPVSEVMVRERDVRPAQ
jgi:hypothetical protein